MTLVGLWEALPLSLQKPAEELCLVLAAVEARERIMTLGEQDPPVCAYGGNSYKRKGDIIYVCL